jgi:hypothetical protein
MRPLAFIFTVELVFGTRRDTDAPVCPKKNFKHRNGTTTTNVLLQPCSCKDLIAGWVNETWKIGGGCLGSPALEVGKGGTLARGGCWEYTFKLESVWVILAYSARRVPCIVAGHSMGAFGLVHARPLLYTYSSFDVYTRCADIPP